MSILPPLSTYLVRRFNCKKEFAAGIRTCVHMFNDFFLSPWYRGPEELTSVQNALVLEIAYIAAVRRGMHIMHARNACMHRNEATRNFGLWEPVCAEGESRIATDEKKRSVVATLGERNARRL